MSIDRKPDMLLWRRNNREDAQGIAPISLRVTTNGQRCELATGVSCPTHYWPTGTHQLALPPNKKKQVLPGFSEEMVDEFNNELHQFKREVLEIYKRLRRPDPGGPLEEVTAEMLRRAVRGETVTSKAQKQETARQRPLLEMARAFIDAAQDAPRADRLADATLASYESKYNTLRKYLAEQNTPRLPAREVDVPWARRYERWLVGPGGGYISALSMRKQINFLQLVQNFAVGEGWLPSKSMHGYKYQTRTPPPSVDSLPAAEVAKLVAALPDLDDACKQAVTGWLFCCYTGLSWVDYRRFAAEPANYLFTQQPTAPGQPATHWLRMVRQKMIRRKPQGFSVPLLEPAADLLLKWKGRLPFSCLTNVNKLLHLVEAELKLSESLTTKLARSTFSQLRRDEGYSDEAVAAMMGDTVTVMNKHYSKVSEQRIALEMARISNSIFLRVA
jgi:hypothetical protein